MIQSDSRIVFVYGPPGAGKTTYAINNKAANDLILDIDALASAITGKAFYEDYSGALFYACAARDAVLSLFRKTPSSNQLWLIAGAPTKLDRLRLLSGEKARTIPLIVDADQCIERIRCDNRRAHQSQIWVDIVRDWWQRYEADDTKPA